MVQRADSANKRRFVNQTRTISWQTLRKNKGSVYLKVNYGKHLDNLGKMTLFTNEGDYRNKTDFIRAFNAFSEK